MPTDAARPVGGCGDQLGQQVGARRMVPSMTMPTSIARPPAVVTSSAWVAARRLVARSA